MDLKLHDSKQTLLGAPIGAGGRVYKTWDGDVLKDVSDEDAAELLSLPDYSSPVEPPAPPQAPEGSTSGDGDPPPADEDPTGSEADEGGDPEEYDRAGLMKLTKAELLEFLDEQHQEAADKLTKAQLVDLILPEEAPDGET